MKCNTLLPQLLLAGFIFLPQLSRAQGCEWERFPEPSADADVIEVLRYGGYGPPAGRTLVSINATGRIELLRHGQCLDRALVGHLETPTFEELARDVERAVEGGTKPLCQSPVDGVDVDVTLYRHGSKVHYQCVTGALLRFGERVLKLVSDAILVSDSR